MSAAVQHLDPAASPDEIAARLPEPARRLLEVVATLYGGSCASCAEDVRRRLAGRPYLYRIDIAGIDVLAWLHRFQTYESARGASLAARRPVTAETRP